jgi:hypothetical protein
MGVTLTANLSLRRPSVEFGELKGAFARLPQSPLFAAGETPSHGASSLTTPGAILSVLGRKARTLSMT